MKNVLLSLLFGLALVSFTGCTTGNDANTCPKCSAGKCSSDQKCAAGKCATDKTTKCSASKCGK